MPTLQENSKMWNDYSWQDRGEEWSNSWGGSKNQWCLTVYPRIMDSIPCETILEIAFGYGRWTKFLLKNCKNYIGIDICQKCVDECSKHFEKGNFFKNDGKDLSAIKDNSIDFCFSYDSLVHSEFDVFESYIPQILKKLTKNGVAFIHHSNLKDLNLDKNIFTHKRAKTCSAKNIKDLILQNGGFIISQELVSWGGVNNLDCYTIFSRSFILPLKKIESDTFLQECEFAKNILSGYLA